MMNKKSLILRLVLAGPLVFASPAKAQDLEDALDAELDAMGGLPPSGQATPEAPGQAVPQQTLPPQQALPAQQTLPPQEAPLQQAISEPAPLPAQSQPKPAPAPKNKPQSIAEPSRPAPSTGGVFGDEPNLQLEQRLYRIFKTAQPIPPDKWSEIIGSRRQDLYVVQSGDTLWDISSTLFGDGFYWSKLWAENSKLENPHVISNGQGIRFLAGTEDAPPTVDVLSQEAVEQIERNVLKQVTGQEPIYREQALKELSADELASGDGIELEELISKPDIPDGVKSRPVLKKLPASFVSQGIKDAGRYDITGIDVVKMSSLRSVANVNPAYYLADRKPEGIGTIDEIEVGENVASVGQSVIVKTSRSLQKGKKLSVLYPRGSVKQGLIGSVGPVIEVGGEIEIDEPIDGKSGIYRAYVISSVNPIRLNSIVSDEPLPKANYGRTGTMLNTELRILGGEFDETRKIIGENSVVYIDGGAKAGLSVGDILPVQSTRGVRRENSRYPDMKKSIGLVKIFKVEPTVASAIVLESQEPIYTGDLTGGTLPGGARKIKESEDDSQVID